MSKPSLLTLLILASACVAGCAITPPVTDQQFCNAPYKVLDVEVRPAGSVAFVDEPTSGTLASDVLQRFDESRGSAPLAGAGEPVSDSMILLSGGSQEGAFGAGFMHGWAEAPGNGIPRARIVTGISTGAIISTFAFLREPEVPYLAYRAEREEEILRPYPGARGGTFNTALTAARRGAVADLSPLRRRLIENISRERMLRLAEEAAAGRALYVGAVDMDSGRAVAFNMTGMAVEYSRGNDPAQEESERQKRIRECYADIIVASSSVPLAAPPTFIDNRMYIDGGARFGVFTHEFEQIIRGLTARGIAPTRSSGGYPYLYVIVNGDLTVDPQCRTTHEEDCRPEAEDPNLGAHRSWSITELAGRSVEVLINQVYRFSVARLHDIGRLHGYNVRVQHIMPDVTEFPFTMPPDKSHLGSGQRTCSQWRLADEQIDDPVEFHPRFMNCLVEYGRRRALTSGWRSHIQARRRP